MISKWRVALPLHQGPDTCWVRCTLDGGDEAQGSGTCRWWGEHAVDDVHHSVGCSEICLDDLGLLDCDSRILLVDAEQLSLLGLDELVCRKGLCIQSWSSDHMVLENGIKLLDVGRLEQGSQRSRGQCSEGLAGGSEDSESKTLRPH